MDILGNFSEMVELLKRFGKTLFFLEKSLVFNQEQSLLKVSGSLGSK